MAGGFSIKHITDTLPNLERQDDTSKIARHQDRVFEIRQDAPGYSECQEPFVAGHGNYII